MRGIGHRPVSFDSRLPGALAAAAIETLIGRPGLDDRFGSDETCAAAIRADEIRHSAEIQELAVVDDSGSTFASARRGSSVLFSCCSLAVWRRASAAASKTRAHENAPVSGESRRLFRRRGDYCHRPARREPTCAAVPALARPDANSGSGSGAVAVPPVGQLVAGELDQAATSDRVAGRFGDVGDWCVEYSNRVGFVKGGRLSRGRSALENARAPSE